MEYPEEEALNIYTDGSMLPGPRRVQGTLVADLRGGRLAREAKAALLALAEEFRRAYPSAMGTIDENADELVSHLLFPSEHRKRLRSTNLLERTFVEVRRRTKVIGRFPGETSALTLIWAVLELASRGWRGVTMTPRTVAEIERIRRARGGSAEPPQTVEMGGEVVAA